MGQSSQTTPPTNQRGVIQKRILLLVIFVFFIAGEFGVILRISLITDIISVGALVTALFVGMLQVDQDILKTVPRGLPAKLGLGILLVLLIASAIGNITQHMQIDTLTQQKDTLTQQKDTLTQQIETLTQQLSAASTPTSPQTVSSVPYYSCPLNSNIVAQLMGVPKASVMVVRDEPCAFKLEATYIGAVFMRQAHCALGYGPNSVEMERVQPHKYIVISCTGHDANPLQDFYVATVRFEKWNPHADACAITQQHWLTDSNIDFPPGCSIPSQVPQP